MKTTDQDLLAKESYVILAVSCLCAILLVRFSLFTAFLVFAWIGFCLYFFRNPKRITPIDPAAVIAPADGVVISISEAQEPHFLNESMTRVSIFMSPFNVHVNRAPESGEVVQTKHFDGKFLAAFDEKASNQNERHAVQLKTSDGRSLVFVQVAGWFARRIVNYTRQGDQIKRGEIIGLIKFGSRMDVYLPKGCTVTVQLRQKVKAGETVIASRQNSGN